MLQGEVARAGAGENTFLMGNQTKAGATESGLGPPISFAPPARKQKWRGLWLGPQTHCQQHGGLGSSKGGVSPILGWVGTWRGEHGGIWGKAAAGPAAREKVKRHNETENGD